MMKRAFPAALALALATLTMLPGCGDDAATTGATESSTATFDSADAATDAPADGAADADDAAAALSEADRQAIAAQKICPVSDEELGSMGDPIKVTVNGKDIYVCCDACVDEAKNNFAKYLAKLEATPAEGDAATAQ
jgi:hypothetical protein